jgi:ribosomal protein S18 acetylase RimI-like enzyme
MSVHSPPTASGLTSLTVPAPTVALHRLDWDTAFFGRLMGTVHLADTDAREQSSGHEHQIEADLRSLLGQAAREGYAHLTLRLPTDNYAVIWAAEQVGFRLIDVGVDSSFNVGMSPLPEPPSLRVREARAEDVGDIAELAADAFRLSRFWADPFFSTEQAREFHREWVRNLYAGLADRVLVCDLDGDIAGFVTGALRQGEGRIPLIATRVGHRRKGLGRSLLSAVLHWFVTAGAERVQVKTQAQNYPALALYHRTGFTVTQSDLTFRVIPDTAAPQ